MKEDNKESLLVKAIKKSDESMLKSKLKRVQETEEDEIDQKIRNGFIYKVYFLVSIQLFILFGMILFAFYSQAFNTIIKTNKLLFYISLITAIIIYCAPIYYDQILTSYPVSYLTIFLFALSSSYVICKYVIIFPPDTIIIASAFTLFSVIALTIYAYFIKQDFSMMSGNIFAGTVISVVGGILTFVLKLKIGKSIVMLLCLFSFCSYLIYDTQLILGNKRMEYKVDDYALAAISLYLDIARIFVELLRIVYKVFFEEDDKNKINIDKGIVGTMFTNAQDKILNDFEGDDEEDKKKGKSKKDKKGKKSKDKKDKKSKKKKKDSDDDSD